MAKNKRYTPRKTQLEQFKELENKEFRTVEENKFYHSRREYSQDEVNERLEQYRQEKYSSFINHKNEKYTRLYNGRNKLTTMLQELVDDERLMISDNKMKRIEECCNLLHFGSDLYGIKYRILRDNRCKSRFCPICSKIKSGYDTLAYGTILKWILDKEVQENEYQFIFVTLTVPNVISDKLKDTIKHLYKSFDILKKYKEIQQMNDGYLTTLEVTYNKKRDDYHPHLHTLFVVKQEYFTSENYLHERRLLELWQKATKNCLISQVDIRKMDTDENLQKAIFEITKYIAKDSHYLYSLNTLKAFYMALHGARMYRSGGIIKEGVKMLKNGDLDAYIDKDIVNYVFKLEYGYKINDEKAYIKRISLLNDYEKQMLKAEGFSKVRNTLQD